MTTDEMLGWLDSDDWFNDKARESVKQALTERDSLKAQLKEWYRKAQDLDAENGVLKVRLAEVKRRAREIRGGGQDANGPLCVVRFYADAIGLIRDLAAEKQPKMSHEEAFVRHIESHLTGDQVPVCKICGKTILEIAAERVEGEEG